MTNRYFDSLASVTDNAGNATSLVYDCLGRKIQQTDPDLGLWKYTYNPTGTIASHTDANSQQITYAYDLLDRLVSCWYPVVWTAETITAGVSQPTVYDLMELRAAIDVNRAAVGLSSGGWTDDEVLAGRGVPIKAVHFNDLQARIQDLWNSAGMGAIPPFTAGAIVAGTRAIKATDLTDLRGWLSEYESSSYGASHRARTFIQYDAYDGSTQFGIGKKCAMWDETGQASWTWDQGGRLSAETRVIDGHSYLISYAYDAHDRIIQLTYPDGEVLTYSYAANLLLGQISSSLGPTYLSGTQYNALDLPSQYTLGSGTTAQVLEKYYGIDVAGAPYGALQASQLQQGSNAMLVDRTLAYDNAGNPTQIVDYVNNETITYGYDEIDRLISAGSPLNESYTYQTIGNLDTKNGIGFTYDPNHKHAVSSYNGTSYGYDANGSMTTPGQPNDQVRYRESAGAPRREWRDPGAFFLRRGRNAAQAAG